VSAVSLGALLGSHLVLFYFASHIMGRRMELRIAAALYIIGTLINIASGTILSTLSIGWYALVFGRLLFGVGVGFTMHGSPTYMAEMAPTSIRGAIVSAKETVIVFGIVMGYAVGDILASSQPWMSLYAVSLFVALPMFGLTFVIPRSKRWLLMHGYRDEAQQSMRFIYQGDIQMEFDKLAASILANRYHRQHSIPASEHVGLIGLLNSRLFSESIRPALTAAMGLILFQQFSGQPSILSYATVLFHAAGWSGHASVVTAILMLGVSSITVVLVDRLGRKRLLLTCVSVLLMASSTLCINFSRWENGASGFEFGATEKTIVLVAMFFYIGGYQIGFGPITWCYVSEVFPGDVRGSATALGVELNYLLNFLVQFLVPSLKDQIGWGPTFGLFACVMLGALSFIRRMVPETAGMSLEEIEEQFARKRKGDVETIETLEPSEHSSLISVLVGVRNEPRYVDELIV